MAQELYELPEGWEWKTLGDSCEMYQPQTISKKQMDEAGQYPVFGANGVIGRYGKYNHEEPEILVTCRGATCGTVNISLPFSWINGNAMVIRPDKRTTNLEFFAFLLMGGIDLGQAITGSAQPQITRASLQPISYPLPPLAEQKRIVAQMDALFGRIDQTKALWASALDAAFENLDESRVKLEKLATKIGSGATPKGGQKAYKEKGIPLIRSLNVYDAELRRKGLAFIDDEQASRLDNVIVEGNDILLNITGASIARCCIAPKEMQGARVNQHVSIIRTVEKMSPRFLNYYLISPNKKKDLLFAGAGGATRQALTKKMIQGLEIPLPPLPEQEKIVAQLDAIAERTQALEATTATQLEQLKALKASLLDAAFRGQL